MTFARRFSPNLWKLIYFCEWRKGWVARQSATLSSFNPSSFGDNVELKRLCCNVNGKKAVGEKVFSANVERKRATATVVCLTFATIPDVFASVREKGSLSFLPSLFLFFTRPLFFIPYHPYFRSDSPSLFLFPTSVFSLLSQTNKLQAELQSRIRLARLDGTFGNFQMQFSNSFRRSFRGPWLFGELASA